MTASPPPGKIITFYSYKGGTGRTMLLANVGWILASAGKRVLMIDWDLEAPGLHHYFHPFLRDRSLKQTDGLIDMVVEHATRMVSPRIAAPVGTDPQDLADSHLIEPFEVDPRDYVVGLDWPAFPKGACLHLMPAGQQNASYSARVNSFDWRDYYDRLGGGTFFGHVSKVLREVYDYVLIDSRTGVSDTSGICTVLMPDSLVVCFAASEANIVGGATTAAYVKAQWDQNRGPATGQRIFPVVTRVEQGEKLKLDAARSHIRELFAPILAPLSPKEQDRHFEQAQVLYWPYYAFEETLAVFGDRSATAGSLLASSEQVASMITEGAVTKLDPPSSTDRARVLDDYERKDEAASAAGEFIILPDDRLNVDVFSKMLLREYGIRTRTYQYDEWASASGNDGADRVPIVLVFGEGGTSSIPPLFWEKLARYTGTRSKRQLVVLILQTAPAKLNLPPLVDVLPKIDLRERPDSGEAMLRLRYALTGGEVVPADDRRLADLRMDWRLRAAATEWNTHGRSQDYLLRGAAYKEFDQFLLRSDTSLPAPVQDFMKASRRIAESESKERNLRRLVISSSIALIVLLFVVVVTIVVTNATVKDLTTKITDLSNTTAELRDKTAEREAQLLTREKDIASLNEKSTRDINVREQAIAEQASRVKALEDEGNRKELDIQQRELTYLVKSSRAALDAGTPLVGTLLAVEAVRRAEVMRKKANVDSVDAIRALREALALVGGRPLQRASTQVTDLAFSDNGGRLAVISSQNVFIADPQSLAVLQEFNSFFGVGHRPKVALDPTGSAVAAMRFDGAVKIWATSKESGFSEQSNLVSPRESDAFAAIGFASGGTELITVSRAGAVEFWDWRTSKRNRIKKLKNWIAPNSPYGFQVVLLNFPFVVSLADPTSKFLVTNRNLVAVNDVTRDPEKAPGRIEIEYPVIALSAEGELITASSKVMVAYNSQGRITDKMDIDFGRGSPDLIVTSPDGKMIFGATGHVIYVWSRERRKLVARLHGHDGDITAMRVNPSGSQLVTADDNGAVRLWDMQRDLMDWGSSAPAQPSTTSRRTQVKVQPTEEALARVEKLSADELIDAAKAVVGSNLECTTWKKYFPMDAYKPTFADLVMPDKCD